jgi:DNA-binding NarL/FixJ family response regulator
LRLEDEMVMPPEMKFSRRELEILKWTAEGKTSAEVAMILSISENTSISIRRICSENSTRRTKRKLPVTRWRRVNLIACVVLRARRKTGCQ